MGMIFFLEFLPVDVSIRLLGLETDIVFSWNCIVKNNKRNMFFGTVGESKIDCTIPINTFVSLYVKL